VALGRHQLLALGGGAQRAQRLLRRSFLLLQRLELGAQRLAHHLEPALLPLDGRGEIDRDRAGLGRRCCRAAAELRAQRRRRRLLPLQLMQQLLLARRARRHRRGQLRRELLLGGRLELEELLLGPEALRQRVQRLLLLLLLRRSRPSRFSDGAGLPAVTVGLGCAWRSGWPVVVRFAEGVVPLRFLVLHLSKTLFLQQRVDRARRVVVSVGGK
jgi:hypothetical protein